MALSELLPVTLREEQSFSTFENSVLRRVFELKRQEVPGGWREVHNEWLCSSYSSLRVTGVMESV